MVLTPVSTRTFSNTPSMLIHFNSSSSSIPALPPLAAERDAAPPPPPLLRRPLARANFGACLLDGASMHPGRMPQTILMSMDPICSPMDLPLSCVTIGLYSFMTRSTAAAVCASTVRSMTLTAGAPFPFDDAATATAFLALARATEGTTMAWPQ